MKSNALFAVFAALLVLVVYKTPHVANAQAVKPCKPTACDAGGGCVDGGTFGLNIPDTSIDFGQVFTSGVTTTATFTTGHAATYVTQVAFVPATMATQQSIGGTFGATAAGGWRFYKMANNKVQLDVFVDIVSGVNITDDIALDAGVLHTICITKTVADDYNIFIDGNDGGLTHTTGSGGGGIGFKFSHLQTIPFDSPFLGKVRNTAFLYDATLNATQCAALHAGTLSIAQFGQDAGMQFGWSLNHTGDSYNGGGHFVQVYGALEFIKTEMP